MQINKTIEQAKSAKEASIKLANVPTEIKNEALKLIAKKIEENIKLILSENQKDVSEAEKTNLPYSLLKRLKLDENKINDMIKGINDIIKLDDPVGRTLSAVELDKGLELYKISCPIGVIGAIFESRPDALVQIATLCLKSGNAVILKGGSEAKNSNKILADLIIESIEKAGFPKQSVQLIETREQVREILKLDKYIDLLIPRGSGKFVKYIMGNTNIAVLGHSEGICHVYVDKDAALDKALGICMDAKCQYPAVCNAMETLLIDKSIAKRFLPIMVEKYFEKDVELRLDEESLPIIKKSIKNKKLLKPKEIHKVNFLGTKNPKDFFVKIKKATETDWKTEYNDLILSIKIVDDVNDAIKHINRYGSKHTDAIVTENKETAERFMGLVDSSSVMWNCSTRFSDGYRYGLGAEVGISTNKIHARGPVGLEGLTIYKYKLVGNGHVVKDYIGKDAREFSHRKIK